jgi:alpha-1,2-mannosyltransferase
MITRTPAGRVVTAAGALTGLLLGIYLVGVPNTPGIGWGLFAQYRLDLDVYRLGAQALADGMPLYGQGFRTGFGEVLPFIYPPIAALLFQPVVLLPMPLAATALTVASGLAAVWVLVRTFQELGDRVAGVRLLLALPLLLLLDPVRMTLFLGQVNLLLLALVIADVLVLRDSRWRGVFVGVAAAIKLTPLVFVVWLLIDGDRRAALRAAVTFAGATALGFVLAPKESLQYWTETLFRLDPMLPVTSSGNQNLRPVAAWFGLPQTATTVLWLVFAIGALALAACAARRCALAGQPLLGALVMSAGGLLASPISWSHHWVWVLPMVPVLFRLGRRVHAISGLVLFAVGPQIVLVVLAGDESGWAPWQHLLATSYSIWAVTALAVVAAGVRSWTSSVPLAVCPDGV